MAIEIREIDVDGYEIVIEGKNQEVGLHCLIAVHSTALGPALGGTRIYPYTSFDEALTDVLRLSKGMTYKSAMAEIGLGGGKSVIIADPKTQKTPELLMAFGEVVDSLKGKYVCAEDMGSNPDDLACVSKTTPYVAALEGDTGSGDPSPFTAWGVFRGIQAVCRELWHSDLIRGKRIAIQGLGHVGYVLAEHLFWHGAELIVCDPHTESCEKAKHYLGAEVVGLDEILSVECDILAPCAIGGVINDQSIEKLRCSAIAGAANNLLLNPEHDQVLADKGILYAPDYVINAGGVINAAMEFEQGGYNARNSRNKVSRLYRVLMSVFGLAQQKQIPTGQAANCLAEYKMSNAIGKRMAALPLMR
ncbi:MAG: leucine dehydrogenase [Waddliaceae bacterium]|nr:leucine dehydrogenase [Waddliaceae bacterium]